MSISNLEAVLTNAMQLSKSADGGAPTYSAQEYEDAALAIADAEQRNGEGMASAFARLAQEGDPRVATLLKAAHRAELAVESAAVARNRALFDGMLDQLAKHEQRAGEPIEATRSRLLHENPIVRDGYAAAWG
jgi:hypothetical protein